MIPPEFIRSPLWKNDTAVRIMVILDARAGTLRGSDMGGHGIVQLLPGECLVGRADLAFVCLSTENKVRSALDALSDAGWIERRTTTHGTFVRLADRPVDLPVTYATPRERQ